MDEQPKKYLDLNGLKVLWRESKKYTDELNNGVSEKAADISKIAFEETAIVNESNISITLKKDNITGNGESSTSVNIPLITNDSAGVITEIIDGNGVTVETPGNGSVKVNVSVDNTSVKISETGEISVDIIDGGTY